MEEANIDLRSDEINDILSRIPIWLIRWGITLIFLLLASVITTLSVLDIPSKINGSATVMMQNKPGNTAAMASPAYTLVLMEIPQENIQNVVIGQTVLFKLRSLPYQKFGMLRGEIYAVSDSVNSNGGVYLKVKVPEDKNPVISRYLKNRMSGTGEIVIGKRSIFKEFILGE